MIRYTDQLVLEYVLDTPTISVVTPCFNCERYVEATIRSVVRQEYPTLEYIFIDGASTDGSLAITKRYADQIAVLVSEPDSGQYYGIQKGLDLATGEIMAWLNGDDVYHPWTLEVVGEIFRKFPEVEWLIGTPSYMNSRGHCTRISTNAGNAYPQKYIRNGWFRPPFAGYLQQESMFWRRSLWERTGGLNLDLAYAADFDLWRRFAEHAELNSVTVPLAMFRQRPGEQRSSTGLVSYEAEVNQICQGLKPPPWYWDRIASKSEKWTHACRLLNWKKCRLITYSYGRQEWIKIDLRRPLARTSLAELLLEYGIRK